MKFRRYPQSVCKFTFLDPLRHVIYIFSHQPLKHVGILEAEVLYNTVEADMLPSTSRAKDLSYLSGANGANRALLANMVHWVPSWAPRIKGKMKVHDFSRTLEFPML